MNVFISQPMFGKTDEEISAERLRIIEDVNKSFGDANIIESFIPGTAPNSKNEALYMLGKSLCMLSDADVAVFAKGWDKSRGCRIEHLAAKEYGVEVVEMEV